MTEVIVTGTKINYYFVCHRKLWFFTRNISMEHNSEKVEIGKTIHEISYNRKKKEIELEGVKIDFFDKNRGLIHEVKKSKSLEESHIWQLKFYLMYFKKLGLELKGEINYPLIRKTEKVELIPGDEIYLNDVVQNIMTISSNTKLPCVINKKICKECSYYELCYV